MKNLALSAKVSMKELNQPTQQKLALGVGNLALSARFSTKSSSFLECFNLVPERSNIINLVPETLNKSISNIINPQFALGAKMQQKLTLDTK